MLEESRKNKEAYRNIEMKLFEERGTWVEEKVKLIDEL